VKNHIPILQVVFVPIRCRVVVAAGARVVGRPRVGVMRVRLLRPPPSLDEHVERGGELRVIVRFWAGRTRPLVPSCRSEHRTGSKRGRVGGKGVRVWWRVAVERD
jgi:hypothetical protein